MTYEEALAEVNRKLELAEKIQKTEPSVIEYYHTVAEACEKQIQKKPETHHRHRGGFRKVKGVDINGYEHEITVDERFEIDDDYCGNCGMIIREWDYEWCPWCGTKIDRGGGLSEAEKWSLMS